MKLIVGLGNPGEKYKTTRHNVGFEAIDNIASIFQFPDFKFQKPFNADISKKNLNGEEIVLAKPLAFMNSSGLTVKKINKNYKLKTENLTVIHDDIDLVIGTFKISQNRGSAGHKGAESIIKTLKTKGFTRIRIGICPIIGKPKNVESFVLKKFSKEEKTALKEAIKIISTQLI